MILPLLLLINTVVYQVLFLTWPAKITVTYYKTQNASDYCIATLDELIE